MKRISVIILAAIALVSCIKEAPVVTNQGTPTPSVQAVESNIVQGSVIVKVTEEMAAALEQSAGMPETKSAEFNAVMKQFGVKKYTRVFDSDPRWVERERREGLHLYYQLEYAPELALATKAAADIAEMPGIESTEVIFKKKLMYTTTPNDQYFSREWHLYNSNGYDLNVRKVWTEFTQGDPKVIVNVVDGGVKPDHPDLLENVIPGKAGGSKNFVNNNYTITGHYHGTHVGGTISATTNNGTGVAGIAGGDYATGKKGVQLLCSQVFQVSAKGEEESAYSFANAMKYGADNGAVISQNSWGYNFDANGDYQISQSEYQNALRAAQSFPNSSEAKAIDYFIKYAGCDNNGNQLPNSPMKGGIVFFSAGNDNIDVGVPAIYESCVAVGAFANTGKKASFSNYGDWVDICAPGQNIYNTSCGDYGTYAYMSGTSMACPMVSGVAALLVSYRGGTGFTNELLKEALIKSADDKIPSSKIGPMVNAYNAMIYKLEPAPDPITSFTATTQANNINFEFKVPARKEKAEPVDGVLLVASKNRSSIESINPANPASDIFSVSVTTGKMKVGDTANGTISKGLDFGTTYYVAAIPFCTGVYATVGTIKDVETGHNDPPTITPQFAPEELNIRSSEIKEFSFLVEDPDNHTVKVEYKKANATESWVFNKNGILQVTVPAPWIEEIGRSYTSTIIATDQYGLATEYQFTYTILPNNPPVVANKFENLVANVGTRQIKIPLEDKFSDPDGDQLVYEVASSQSSIVKASATSTGLNLSFGSTTGEAKLTIIARDARGAEARQSFQVLLRVQGENVSLYPTQVTNTLTVGTGNTLSDTHIDIISQLGAVVYSFDGKISAFKPVALDLSSLAPGRYQVKVTFDGETYTKTIVKL